MPTEITQEEFVANMKAVRDLIDDMLRELGKGGESLGDTFEDRTKKAMEIAAAEDGWFQSVRDQRKLQAEITAEVVRIRDDLLPKIEESTQKLNSLADWMNGLAAELEEQEGR